MRKYYGTYRSTYLPVCLHTYHPTYLPIDLPPCLIYIPTNISTYLFMYLPVWICTYQLTYLPMSCIIIFFPFFLFCFASFFVFWVFAGASSPERPAGARATYMFSWKVFGFVCLSANAAAAAAAVAAPALVAARGRGVLFAFYYNAVRRSTLQLGHGGCQSSLLFTLAGSTTSSSFSVTAPESSASSPTVPM